MLHLYMDIPLGNENEPVALKTKLGWVIFAGRQNDNKYPNINTFCNEFDLGNMVSKFWQIESFDVSKKTKPKHFTTNGTICFKYLRKTAKNTNNLYTVGLLWDEGNVKL